METEFGKMRRKYVELRRKWRAPIARWVLTGSTRRDGSWVRDLR